MRLNDKLLKASVLFVIESASSRSRFVVALIYVFLIGVGLSEIYSFAGRQLEASTWLVVLAINLLLALIAVSLIPSVRASLFKVKVQASYYYPSIVVVLGSVFLALAWPSTGSAREEDFWFLICSITVIPLAEEILFRGVINNFFRKYIRHDLWSVYLSAFVFAWVHTNPTLARVFQLESGIPMGPFLLGLICGWLMVKSQSLLVPIAFHCACNSTVLIFNRLSPDWFDRFSLLYL